MKGIVVDNVGKTFVTQSGVVEALRDASLYVGDGQFASIVGESGCGKSTLLKILAGLYQPTSGRVTLNGREMAGVNKEVGLVFQQPVLLPWKTVLENVLFPIEILRLSKEKYKSEALSLLRLVGLEDFTNHYPYQLSGGMQQRNAIARGLIHDPQILLLDEPFGALDALTRERMSLEIQNVWMDRHKTMLLVTHSISEAAFLSDVVFIFSPRPGTVWERVEIPFPRPRSLDLMGSAEFAELARKIRWILEGKGKSK
jgi:NitT/TauT family transport system ATP-binding protein